MKKNENDKNILLYKILGNKILYSVIIAIIVVLCIALIIVLFNAGSLKDVMFKYITAPNNKLIVHF